MIMLACGFVWLYGLKCTLFHVRQPLKSFLKAYVSKYIPTYAANAILKDPAKLSRYLEA